jgi:hypothetical protein
MFNDLTVELLHPFQSTRDLDGIHTDREVVQDIAYDGEVAYSRRIRGHLTIEQGHRRQQGSAR